jgi:putative endopeptidase
MKVSLGFRSLTIRFVAAFALAVCLLSARGAVNEEHLIVLGELDRSFKPGDDFYRYCSGSWIKQTEIPPDRAAVSVFTLLTDLSDKRTADLIKEVSKSNAKAGSGEPAL